MNRIGLNGTWKKVAPIAAFLVLFGGLVTAYTKTSHQVQVNAQGIVELKDMAERVRRIELILVRLAAEAGVDVGFP